MKVLLLLLVLLVLVLFIVVVGGGGGGVGCCWWGRWCWWCCWWLVLVVGGGWWLVLVALVLVPVLAQVAVFSVLLVGGVLWFVVVLVVWVMVMVLSPLLLCLVKLVSYLQHRVFLDSRGCLMLLVFGGHARGAHHGFGRFAWVAKGSMAVVKTMGMGGIS